MCTNYNATNINFYGLNSPSGEPIDNINVSINRNVEYFTVTVPSGTTVSNEFSVRQYSFGSYSIVDTPAGTGINFETKMEDSINWGSGRDMDGNVLNEQPIIVDNVIPIPTHIMFSDLARFKLSDTQSSNVDILVLLKG